MQDFSSLQVKILVLNIKEKINITGMIAFATRNLKFYFRDKGAVFFNLRHINNHLFVCSIRISICNVHMSDLRPDADLL